VSSALLHSRARKLKFAEKNQPSNRVKIETEKYCACQFLKIGNHSRHPALMQGGVSRTSHTRGGDAVDAEVPRTNGTEADGEIVWS